MSFASNLRKQEHNSIAITTAGVQPGAAIILDDIGLASTHRCLERKFPTIFCCNPDPRVLARFRQVTGPAGRSCLGWFSEALASPEWSSWFTQPVSVVYLDYCATLHGQQLDPKTWKLVDLYLLLARTRMMATVQLSLTFNTGVRAGESRGQTQDQVITHIIQVVQDLLGSMGWAWTQDYHFHSPLVRAYGNQMVFLSWRIKRVSTYSTSPPSWCSGCGRQCRDIQCSCGRWFCRGSLERMNSTGRPCPRCQFVSRKKPVTRKSRKPRSIRRSRRAPYRRVLLLTQEPETPLLHRGTICPDTLDRPLIPRAQGCIPLHTPLCSKCFPVHAIVGQWRWVQYQEYDYPAVVVAQLGNTFQVVYEDYTMECVPLERIKNEIPKRATTLRPEMESNSSSVHLTSIENQ